MAKHPDSKRTIQAKAKAQVLRQARKDKANLVKLSK